MKCYIYVSRSFLANQQRFSSFIKPVLREYFLWWFNNDCIINKTYHLINLKSIWVGTENAAKIKFLTNKENLEAYQIKA